METIQTRAPGPFGFRCRRVANVLYRGPLLFVVLALSAAGSAAPAADELEQELEFSSQLARWGLPQYATKLLERLLVQHPEAKDRARPVLVDLKLAAGKLGEAEEMINALNPADPHTQTNMLNLAIAYFQRQQTAKTKALFDRFLNQPIVNSNLYRNAAFQYSELLERAGDIEGAIKAFQYIEKMDPAGRSDEGLQAQCIQADLLLKLAQREAVASNRTTRMTAAEKLCDKVLNHGISSSFGKALITKANIQLAGGKRTEAGKLLMENMDILRSIDEELESQNRLAQSPMAGARMLLGDIYFAQAQERLKAQPPKITDVLAQLSQAMTQYINVLKKYPLSDVIPDVLQQADKLNALLRTLGRAPVDLSKHAAGAMAGLIKSADEQYRAGEYEDAAQLYLRVLNQMPEGEASVGALVNLMLAYGNRPGADHALLAKMMALYLCERFSHDPRAGTGVLQLAEVYNTAKDPSRSVPDKAADEQHMLAYYELFLKYFPKHPKKGAMLYRLAFLRNQVKDEAGALKLLQQIVDELPNDPYYAKALGQMAWSYYSGSNYVQAVKGFTAYIAQAQPGAEKAQAQLFLANAYKQVGQYREALAGLDELIAALTPANSPYNTSSAEVKKNTILLEQAVFQRGVSYASLKEPAGQIPEFRRLGLQAMDDFLKRYPASTLAPKALRAKGAILLETGKFTEAAAVFDELAVTYPNTDEGKSALFSLARSAVEVKQYDQAKAAFGKMMAQADKFAPEYFLAMGRIFAEAKLPGEAALAYEQAMKPAGNGPVEELALFGLAQANLTTKAYAAAVQHLTALLKKYPATGFFFDAKFALAEAAREAGQYEVASTALGDVLRQATKPVQRIRANFETGKLQVKKGEKSAALGSFQLVAQLEDPKNLELAPWIEQAIMESVHLAMELQRYDAVFQNCDLYEQYFRDGKNRDEIRKTRNDAKFKAGRDPR